MTGRGGNPVHQAPGPDWAGGLEWTAKPPQNDRTSTASPFVTPTINPKLLHAAGFPPFFCSVVLSIIVLHTCCANQQQNNARARACVCVMETVAITLTANTLS